MIILGIFVASIITIMGTMFKTKRPRQFNLKTRYWSPEQEERKRRNERMQRQKEDYDFDAEEFKKELAYRWSMNRVSKSKHIKSQTSISRLLLFSLAAGVIIAILLYMQFY